MRRLENSTPRTEFPNSSSRGLHDAIPHTPGMVMNSAPDTPDFAGSPTVKANSPEKSYMPQEAIRDRQFFTVSLLKPRSFVGGQTPPLASVAATTAICGAVTVIEQH